MNPQPSTFDLKNRGPHEEFASGSCRDTRSGRGRFDLISPIFLRRLAILLEKGALKYGERNWEKGQNLSRFLDSAFSHLLAVMEGREDEDHLTQAAWNIQALMHTLEKVRSGELPRALVDLPYPVPQDAAAFRRQQNTPWPVNPHQGGLCAVDPDAVTARSPSELARLDEEAEVAGYIGAHVDPDLNRILADHNRRQGDTRPVAQQDRIGVNAPKFRCRRAGSNPGADLGRRHDDNLPF